MKLTYKREEILKVIKEVKVPICVEDIYNTLIKNQININLSTVYRGLDFLVKNDLIRVLNIGDKNKSYYEKNSSKHHHYLRCLGCNEMIPLDDCPVKEYEKRLGKDKGYVVLGHKLEIVGYCKNCNNKLLGV